jgi:hypothetical protein
MEMGTKVTYNVTNHYHPPIFLKIPEKLMYNIPIYVTARNNTSRDMQNRLKELR